MSLDHMKSQEGGSNDQAPKPFNPKDTARIDELTTKFEGTKSVEKLTNNYMIGRTRVTIDLKSPDVTISPDGKSRAFTFSASVNDPDAPNDFKGVDRWVDYRIHLNEKGEVGFVNRIDNRGSEGFRPTYQVHDEEIEKLLKTAEVAEYVGPHLKKD